MKVTIDGMTFEGSEDEIRRIAENPPHNIASLSTTQPSKELHALSDIDAKKCESISIATTEACRNGFRESSTCPYYRSGYCEIHTLALASYPPKYQRCDFCIDVPMYKKCSEV